MARIRIGNQTAYFATPVIRPFEYAVAHGFDAFEWFADKKESGEGWTEDDISKETRAFIRKTSAAQDIFLSVHALCQSNPMKPETCGFLPGSVEFARDIGAKLLNIHFFSGEGVGAYIESIIPLMNLLLPAGIKLSIENTPDTAPQDLNDLFRYLSDVRPSYISSVGMCLDIGHANLHDATRNDYLRYIDLLAPEVPIIHLHLHENYGDYDSHLAVFTGPAGKDPSGIKGVIDRLKKRNFSGSVILEQWPQPPGLLDKARSRLLDMIGDYSARLYGKG